MKISVAMATYNGEKYIREQLLSVLENLGPDDEVIVSDDDSKDSTLSVIKSINDGRIKVIKGPCKGVIKNFENALKNCSGKIIFLCDQDDIWAKNKVRIVLKCFEKHPECTCVVHDARVIDENKNVMMTSYFEYRKSKPGLINNIYKNSYMGCCMAIKRKLLDCVLPIPEKVTMHDQWIGLCSDKKGKSIFIKKQLICYRRHSDAVTDFKHTSIPHMISTRLYYVMRLFGIK